MPNSSSPKRNIHHELFQGTEIWYGLAMKRAGILLASLKGALDPDEYAVLRAAVDAEEVEAEAAFVCASPACRPCYPAYLAKQAQRDQARREKAAKRRLQVKP